MQAFFSEIFGFFLPPSLREGDRDAVEGVYFPGNATPPVTFGDSPLLEGAKKGYLWFSESPLAVGEDPDGLAVCADGVKETYSLLGAWDGNPERKFLSYKTRLGEAVLNRKVGDSFKIGDRGCKLVAVRPLPAELIAELDA